MAPSIATATASLHAITGSGAPDLGVPCETSAKINLANPEEWPGAAAAPRFQGD